MISNEIHYGGTNMVVEIGLSPVKDYASPQFQGIKKIISLKQHNLRFQNNFRLMTTVLCTGAPNEKILV